MPSINMLSSADMVKGQGVGSAYKEQVSLVSQGLKEEYQVFVNSRKHCDIVHFHTINPEYFIKLGRDKKRSAFVGYVHFLPETVENSLDIPKAGKKLFYKYMIEFYKSMDYLVTVNPYFIKELGKYGIEEKKVTYIPNYVSDQLFFLESDEKRNEFKEKWDIAQGRFVVLGVGQVQTRKGVLDFVETAKRMPDALFIWAGGFSFGPMTEGYKELKQVMSEPPENVLFPGIVERERMNELYNVCDVMFLPSFQELFPMTILESMCVKRPVLLRDLDIYPAILFDYYLKGNSVDEFTGILERLGTNKEYYNTWSEQSDKGNQFYSKENVLHLWETFYNNVYEENKERILTAAQRDTFHKKWTRTSRNAQKAIQRRRRASVDQAERMREKLFFEFRQKQNRLVKEFHEEWEKFMKLFRDEQDKE